MKYTMKVTIHNPETPAEMTSDLLLIIDCNFAYDAEQYGNGHYVSLKNKNLPFGKEIIDLRYDKTFDRDNKTEWLEKWARNYWSGKNGAYAVKKLAITKAE